MTEIGAAGYKQVVPAPGGEYFAGQGFGRGSGEASSGGGGSSSSMGQFGLGGAYGPDLTLGGVHDQGRAVGSGIGTQVGLVSQALLEDDYDLSGYQPVELDGGSSLNGMDQAATDWSHEDIPSRPIGPAPVECAMDATEWAAHQAQMAADYDHARRKMWWWLAGGAAAGFIAARLWSGRMG